MDTNENTPTKIDLDDLDTYDTSTLERAAPHAVIAAELIKRATEQAARRRCDECWHEGGDHAPACSSVTQATRCGCCESASDERPAVHSAARESNDWVASTMKSIGLGGGVL